MVIAGIPIENCAKRLLIKTGSSRAADRKFPATIPWRSQQPLRLPLPRRDHYCQHLDLFNGAARDPERPPCDFKVLMTLPHTCSSKAEPPLASIEVITCTHERIIDVAVTTGPDAIQYPCRKAEMDAELEVERLLSWIKRLCRCRVDVEAL